MTSGAACTEGRVASPAMAQNRGRPWPVSTRKAWPWQNPAEGPRTALTRMRSTLGCGTGSLVDRRTMCLRRTTSKVHELDANAAV